MSNNSLAKFERNGLELWVDEATGLAYTTASSMARMFPSTSKPTILRRLKGVQNEDQKQALIHTGGGMQGGTLYPASVVFKLAIEFNVELAKAMGEAGANVYMCGLAGYRTSLEQAEPKTRLELAKEQVRLIEELELKDELIRQLEADNDRQAEVIDELFDYSSIIRVAKFNGCDEKAFNWRQLKAGCKVLGLEIKIVPCPRFGTKNLYPHQAWRFVYPDYSLPETTTLRLGE